MKFYLPIAFCALSLFAAAQQPVHDRKIQFPDIEGYRTLKCDFHIHTVFSDGEVWPSIRIEEAIKDGLDAVSMTEHLEYQPHKKDIPHPDRNRSYEIALEAAKENDLIVVNGSEITRSMPPGHSNAIFIKDANKLMDDDPIKVFREAKKQGAFIFWNHPNWTAQRKDGVATLTDMHRQLIAEKLLDGIEVVNDLTFSDEALQIANDQQLTVMGTSDIHGLVDWQYHLDEGGHRPVTLVFAAEKSAESIREALFAGRTVAWYNNLLAGKNEYLVPLIQAALQVQSAKYQDKSSVADVVITNHSDADYILENASPYTLHTFSDLVVIKAHQTLTLEVKTLERLSTIDLTFKVLNAVSAPKTHPSVILRATVAEK